MRGNKVSRLAWFALLLAGVVHAVPVNFQGALVEALPCTVNGGQLIEVDFGDGIVIRNIDGVRYSKTIAYQIECSAAGAVRLSIKGTPAPFDGAAIQTDAAGLGIHLTQAGQPFTLNSPISVNPASPPVLAAVPVADPGSPPGPGAFTARATLLAEYQ
ncbi:fimbrial protein [Aeromonas salmonicida]|uniref:fimbrial protein n=1 Tax=Aeromonas salmonicida TaxID=645 RepID=UPI0031FC6E55